MGGEAHGQVAEGGVINTLFGALSLGSSPGSSLCLPRDLEQITQDSESQVFSTGPEVQRPSSEIVNMPCPGREGGREEAAGGGGGGGGWKVGKKEGKGRKGEGRGSCCLGPPCHQVISTQRAPIPARHTLPHPAWLHEVGNKTHSGEPRTEKTPCPSPLSSVCPLHPLLFQISFASLTETSQATRWARVMPVTQMRSSIRLFLEQRLSTAFGEEGLWGGEWEACSPL